MEELHILLTPNKEHTVELFLNVPAIARVSEWPDS